MNFQTFEKVRLRFPPTAILALALVVMLFQGSVTTSCASSDVMIGSGTNIGAACITPATEVRRVQRVFAGMNDSLTTQASYALTERLHPREITYLMNLDWRTSSNVLADPVIQQAIRVMMPFAQGACSTAIREEWSIGMANAQPSNRNLLNSIVRALAEHFITVVGAAGEATIGYACAVGAPTLPGAIACIASSLIGIATIIANDALGAEILPTNDAGADASFDTGVGTTESPCVGAWIVSYPAGMQVCGSATTHPAGSGWVNVWQSDSQVYADSNYCSSMVVIDSMSCAFRCELNENFSCGRSMSRTLHSTFDLLNGTGTITSLCVRDCSTIEINSTIVRR